MSKVEKLDLMGVATLAAVAAVVLTAWVATTPRGIETTARGPVERAVSLTDDGRMKLTVTAPAAAAVAAVPVATRTASTASSGIPSL